MNLAQPTRQGGFIAHCIPGNKGEAVLIMELVRQIQKYAQEQQLANPGSFEGLHREVRGIPGSGSPALT